MKGRVEAGPRGVIFDLDGTLYALGSALKLRLSARLWRSLGLLRHVSAARDSLRGREFADAEELDAALFAELGRRANTDSEAAGRWYTTDFLPNFVSVLAAHRTARPGTQALLSRLRERGLKLAVLSDYGVVDERLEALEISVEAFDVRCSANEAGALKPSPRPFVMVAERLGLDPEQVLAVGDRDDMDLAGARAAGMQYRGLAGPRSGATQAWPELLESLEQLGR